MEKVVAERFAATLKAAAESKDIIYGSWYGRVRGQVLTVTDEELKADVEAILPDSPPLGAYTDEVIGGRTLLLAAAAFLNAVARERGPSQARRVAATDLLEQARTLLEDKKTHVAAPILLAGAALEEVLRDLIEDDDLEIDGRPGLNAYAQALRKARRITDDQAKAVLSLASTRNAAAHGQFDELSRERAGIMLEHVDLLVRQLGAEGSAD